MKKHFLVPILLAAAGALNLFAVGVDVYNHGSSEILSARLGFGIMFTILALVKFRKARPSDSAPE